MGPVAPGSSAGRFRGGWLVLGAVACAGLSLAAGMHPALALPGDAAAIAKASDLDNDPQDILAVTQVCTRCHVATQFLGAPRSSGRWEQVYEQMTTFGASGTEDQLNRVVAYFQKNLTIVNVNTSPPDELEPTLQIGDDAVNAILARRAKAKFKDVADLSTIKGVDPVKLRKLAANGRLLF